MMAIALLGDMDQPCSNFLQQREEGADAETLTFLMMMLDFCDRLPP